MATNNAINALGPLPEFFATLSTTALAVTGDSTLYKLALALELYDTTNSFSTVTYEFTAPITGKYRLIARTQLHSLTAAHTLGYITIVTTARGYVSNIVSPGAIRNSSNATVLACDVIADMTLGDTAYVEVIVANGAKVVDCSYNSPAVPRTFFQGYLIR